jgi:hypothetical protein
LLSPAGPKIRGRSLQHAASRHGSKRGATQPRPQHLQKSYLCLFSASQKAQAAHINKKTNSISNHNSYTVARLLQRHLHTLTTGLTSLRCPLTTLAAMPANRETCYNDIASRSHKPLLAAARREATFRSLLHNETANDHILQHCTTMPSSIYFRSQTIRTHTHNKNILIHTHTHIHAHTSTHTHAPTHTHTYTHTRTHTPTPKHTQTHTPTHTHTVKPRESL